MEPVSNDENNYPKSLGRLGYNTAYKNTIQFNKNNLSKKLARTPLKSKLNLMNSSQEQNSIKNQNEKMLKYPLLKSISSSNINFKNKKNISYAINNDDTYNYDEEDEYNKGALPDEIEDFMHIHENEIIMKNDIDDIDMNKATEYKKNDMKILDKVISPFDGYDNYVLGAHFDEDDGDNNNTNSNEFNSKKKFDEYFEESNDIDMIDSDN